MNINDLTISQVKEISDMFSATKKEATLTDDFVGKYVICRSRSEGVNAGKVVRADSSGVILEDARRLYYHKPINKNVSWYEGVAKTGISDDSRVGTAVTKLIVEDYSLTVCTTDAEKTIRESKENEQS